MAVEFRHRGWIDRDHLQQTLEICKKERLVLVASDDLKHEQEDKDRDQKGLPEGEFAVHLPTVLELTSPAAGLYIRVHRRHGKERVLKEEEIEKWACRIRGISGGVKQKGLPIYVLWGTDHVDQPMINASNLEKACPELCASWREKHLARARGALLEAFRPSVSRDRSDSSPSAGIPEMKRQKTDGPSVAITAGNELSTMSCIRRMNTNIDSKASAASTILALSAFFQPRRSPTPRSQSHSEPAAF